MFDCQRDPFFPFPKNSAIPVSMMPSKDSGTWPNWLTNIDHDLILVTQMCKNQTRASHHPSIVTAFFHICQRFQHISTCYDCFESHIPNGCSFTSYIQLLPEAAQRVAWSEAAVPLFQNQRWPVLSEIQSDFLEWTGHVQLNDARRVSNYTLPILNIIYIVYIYIYDIYLYEYIWNYMNI